MSIGNVHLLPLCAIRTKLHAGNPKLLGIKANKLKCTGLPHETMNCSKQILYQRDIAMYVCCVL